MHIWKYLSEIYKTLCARFTWLNNLILYGLFGFSAAVLDYALFFVMANYGKVIPELASLSGNICGFLFTFSCNTFFNFKNTEIP